MKIVGLVVLGFFVLAGSMIAQLDPGATVHRLRVHVEFTNGTCDHSVQVKLMAMAGPVTESTPNERCEAEFVNIPAGTYNVNVSGIGFASVDNTISAENGSPDVNIKVKRANEPDGTVAGAAGASVSATDLAIPAKAQKEFDKAQRLIDRQDFKKAIQTLNHAVTIYPSYASAYNNLGVVYARMGDHDKEREALDKAIRINNHFAPAYVNLGRLDISTNNYVGAEQELTKATTYDPTDAMTLVLLAYSEFMDKHFDLAIASARRAHGLQGEHAFAHQVAARSYEQKRDGRDAIAELQLFLKEEPTGSRADIARKELGQLQAIVARSVFGSQ